MREMFERIYTGSSEDYYKKLKKYVDKGTIKFILTANPEMIYIAKDNKVLKDAIMNKENDVVSDGIAIKKMAKYYGIDIKERIPGCDIANLLLNYGAKKKKSIYLFGAEEEVVKALADLTKTKYKGLKLLGYTNGYIKDKEKEFEKVVKLNPDICLVALGIPMQEELIISGIKNAKKGIYVGVGGSFDVLSGTKKRAPKLFIKLNLEWLYRIFKEPKRLKRFYKYNIKFCQDVIKDSKKAKK